MNREETQDGCLERYQRKYRQKEQWHSVSLLKEMKIHLTYEMGSPSLWDVEQTDVKFWEKRNAIHSSVRETSRIWI